MKHIKSEHLINEIDVRSLQIHDNTTLLGDLEEFCVEKKNEENVISSSSLVDSRVLSYK